MTLIEVIEEVEEEEALEAKEEEVKASLVAEVEEIKDLMLMKENSQLFERVDRIKVNMNNKRAKNKSPSCKE